MSASLRPAEIARRARLGSAHRMSTSTRIDRDQVEHTSGVITSALSVAAEEAMISRRLQRLRKDI